MQVLPTEQCTPTLTGEADHQKKKNQHNGTELFHHQNSLPDDLNSIHSTEKNTKRLRRFFSIAVQSKNAFNSLISTVNVFGQ